MLLPWMQICIGEFVHVQFILKSIAILTAIFRVSVVENWMWFLQMSPCYFFASMTIYSHAKIWSSNLKNDDFTLSQSSTTLVSYKIRLLNEWYVRDVWVLDRRSSPRGIIHHRVRGLLTQDKRRCPWNEMSINLK